MSGWIKMRTELRQDPAVFAIAKRTKLDRLTVIGCLYSFWVWADAHAVEGRVTCASSDDVDEVCGKRGFASALVDVGWLECDESGINIPRHDRHNGESAKERALKNARQAQWRKRVDPSPSTSASTRPSTKTSTAPSTGVDGPSSTDASTRGEEKREENKNQKKKTANGSPTDRDRVFAFGLPLLTASNVSETNARSMLGLMCKQHGDAAVAGVLERCAEERPLSPVPWLQAALKVNGTARHGGGATAAEIAELQVELQREEQRNAH